MDCDANRRPRLLDDELPCPSHISFRCPKCLTQYCITHAYLYPCECPPPPLANNITTLRTSLRPGGDTIATDPAGNAAWWDHVGYYYDQHFSYNTNVQTLTQHGYRLPPWRILTPQQRSTFVALLNLHPPVNLLDHEPFTLMFEPQSPEQWLVMLQPWLIPPIPEPTEAVELGSTRWTNTDEPAFIISQHPVPDLHIPNCRIQHVRISVLKPPQTSTITLHHPQIQVYQFQTRHNHRAFHIINRLAYAGAHRPNHPLPTYIPDDYYQLSDLTTAKFTATALAFLYQDHHHRIPFDEITFIDLDTEPAEAMLTIHSPEQKNRIDVAPDKINQAIALLRAATIRIL